MPRAPMSDSRSPSAANALGRGRWQSWLDAADAKRSADQGDHLDALQVEGVAGGDANLRRDPELRDRRDAPPGSLEIVDFVPIVRVLDKTRVTEIAIDVPADGKTRSSSQLRRGHGRSPS